MKQALFLGLIIAGVVGGCEPTEPAHSPLSNRPGAERNPLETAAKCVTRESEGKTERIYLDASGNIVFVDRAPSGEVRFSRSSDGSLLEYEVRRRGRSTRGVFTFGPNHEVKAISLRGVSHYAAELEWKGRFGSAQSRVRPFVPYGGAGGVEDLSGTVQVLSADLTIRHGSNPMMPLSFSGQVHVRVIEEDPHQEIYTYQDGRLVTWTDGRGNGHQYEWDDEGHLLHEESCTVDAPGERRKCRRFRTEKLGEIWRTTMNTGEMVLDHDEEGRLVAGQFGGKTEQVKWGECAVGGK